MSTPVIVSGFSLLASYDASGDSVSSYSASLTSTPAATYADTSLALMWVTNNVSTIRLTGGTSFDTGVISTAGLGVYTVADGFGATTTIYMACYSAYGALLTTVSTVVTILPPGMTIDVDGSTVGTDVSILDVDGIVLSTDVTSITTD